MLSVKEQSDFDDRREKYLHSLLKKSQNCLDFKVVDTCF